MTNAGSKHENLGILISGLILHLCDACRVARRTVILERHVDVARLFGAYTWGTLPTRYLTAYTPADKLAAMDAVAQKRAERIAETKGPGHGNGTSVPAVKELPTAAGKE